MLPNDPRSIPKIKVVVELYTLDGAARVGTVYVNPDQRVSDLVNGHARFLPFRRGDGEFELINKRTIARLVPRDRNVLCRSSQSELDDLPTGLPH